MKLQIHCTSGVSFIMQQINATMAHAIILIKVSFVSIMSLLFLFASQEKVGALFFVSQKCKHCNKDQAFPFPVDTKCYEDFSELKLTTALLVSCILEVTYTYTQYTIHCT